MDRRRGEWYNKGAVKPLWEASLILDNIGKSYGRRRVLHRISLSAQAGDVVIVTGANGSGKSTLLKIVAGLVRPSQGDVRLAVSGEDALDPGARRRAVGYTAPDLALYPELSGTENLRFFAAVRGLSLPPPEAAQRLAEVGLSGRGNDFVGTYSSGMRQRLRLAFAVLGSPAVLLLDEPSLALDESGAVLVAEMVAAHRAAGGLTLLATNDARERALGERGLALGG